MRPSLFIAGLAVALGLPAVASAATFFELGDAGQLPTTANLVTTPSPSAIVGNIQPEDDADLFALHLTAGVLFTASTATSAGISDTQLFLFDGLGKGLRYNDDIDTTNFFSRVSFTPTLSGTYYLGISGAGFNPQDGAGTPSFLYVSDPFDPTLELGPSSAGALAGWAGVAGSFRDSGAYRIELTGAAPVPEPGSLALLALGLAALATVRRFVHGV